MVRRWFIPLAGLALVAGSLAITGPASAARASHQAQAHQFRPGGPFHPAPGAQPATADGSRINYSTNWSGFAVTGGTFTTTTASWTQPAITCTGSGYTDMSPWVGIDGFGNQTVEQTGTSGDCNGSTPDYYAWYEMYPVNFVTISQTVAPGDQFTATVTHTTASKYTLTLVDLTQGWTNSVTKAHVADDSSAEAVLEMAASQLTQFSTDPFTGFTVDCQPASAYRASPYQLRHMEIRVNGTLCDSTTNLTNTENFKATWLKAC